MVVRSKIALAGDTHCGLVRARNEDNFCLVNLPGDNASLVIVADGVGGHCGGDMASYICCRMMLDAWRARKHRELSVEGAQAFLHHTIDAVNEKLWTRNRFFGTGESMGTTVVCSVVFAEHIVIAHAGDSRLYMAIPGRGLVLLTRDHSVNRLLEDRQISAAAVRCGARADSALFQAVGTCRSLDAEVQVLERPAAARYLWCSDGLYRYVPEERLLMYMENNDTARMALDQLIRDALLAGAPDNVAVVCGFPVS